MTLETVLRQDRLPGPSRRAPGRLPIPAGIHT